MKPLLLILIAAQLFVTSALSESPSRTLKEVITRAREIPATSLHQWLRDQGILADTFKGGITFEEAVNTAKAAKLPLLDGWQNGSAILRRYKLKDSVFKFPDGKSADAYLFFRALNKTDGGSPFVSTGVHFVEIGLLIHVGLTYQETTDRKIFADGTALCRSLDLGEVKEAGASWPRLDRILIDYGRDGNRWLEFNPSGFHFEIRFLASETDELGYKQISGFIASGLDPLRSWEGKPAPGDFVSEDYLGDPDYQGGSYTDLKRRLLEFPPRKSERRAAEPQCSLSMTTNETPLTLNTQGRSGGEERALRLHPWLNTAQPHCGILTTEGALQPRTRRIAAGFQLFSHPKNAAMVELHAFGIRSPRCQNRCVLYPAL